MRKLVFVINEAYFFLTHRLAVARAAERAGFEVHIACPGDHVWAPPDFTNEKLASSGFFIHEIPISRRGTNLFQELQTFWALLRLYRKLRPALIHQLTIKPILYGGIAARIVRAPAVVNTVTGLGQVFVERGWSAIALRALVKILYRLSLKHVNSELITQNRQDGDTLIKLGLADRNRIHLVRGSGVDLEAFSPSPEPMGKPLVILPARLIWEKGIAEFIAAARLIHKSGTQARFILVGDTQPSNPRAVPEAQLKSWVREGIIEWWGRREDMPCVYAQSHIVCLPSRYGEGVPKVLLEASASARPIITTDIPGCREVVSHEVNGLIVSIKDDEAMSAALLRLICDKDLREQLGTAGRQIAEREFGEALIADQTLSVYQHVLSQQRPASSR